MQQFFLFSERWFLAVLCFFIIPIALKAFNIDAQETSTIDAQETSTLAFAPKLEFHVVEPDHIMKKTEAEKREKKEAQERAQERGKKEKEERKEKEKEERKEKAKKK